MSRLARFFAVLIIATVVPTRVADAVTVPVPARLSSDLAAALKTASPTERFVVFVQGETPEVARRAVRTAGLSSVGELESIGAPIAVGTAAQISALAARSGVRYVERDEPMAPALQTARTASRVAETLAAESPYAAFDGTGQTIAVIDSGVDGTHPMFALPDGTSKVVRNLRVVCLNLWAEAEAAGLPETLVDVCPSTVTGDRVDDEPFIVDVTAVNDTDTLAAGGHGTLVASTAAGVEVTTDEATPRSLAGVATGAKIVALGVGIQNTMYGAAAALDWVVRHHADPCGGGDLVACPPITVVNNSYGRAGEWDPNSVHTALQRALVDAGVTPVWVHMNEGGDGSVSMASKFGTAQIPGVLTIAAYDDGGTGRRDGGVHPFSSRGDRARPATWPDLAAPGVNITSACRPHLPSCNPDEDPNYGTHSGTSLAAPHVAGAIAMLQQASLAHTGRLRTPAEVEDLLEDTAHKFADDWGYAPDPANPDDESSFDKGHGLLDVVNAMNALFGADATEPPDVVAECALATDAGGDATSQGDVDTGVNEPTLDVTSVDVVGDPVAETLAVVFHVADLRDENPVGTTGIAFDAEIRIGDQVVFVEAERGVDRPTLGTFDVHADTVTVTIPRHELGVGGEIVVDSMTNGRSWVLRAVLASAADQFEGACPQIVDVGGDQASGLRAAPGAPAVWSGLVTTVVTPPLGLPVPTVIYRGMVRDSRHVEIVVPEGGTVTFTLGCDKPTDDFDIELHGPDGLPIGVGRDAVLGDEWEGSSGNVGCVEEIVVTNAPAGSYVATVAAFETVEATYAATVTVS